MWLQRSLVTWLKEGDKNTMFFHSRVVWRAKKNKIKKLRNQQGEWVDKPEEMEQLATDFFKNLFTVDPSLDPEEIV